MKYCCQIIYRCQIKKIVAKYDVLPLNKCLIVAKRYFYSKMFCYWQQMSCCCHKMVTTDSQMMPHHCQMVYLILTHITRHNCRRGMVIRIQKNNGESWYIIWGIFQTFERRNTARDVVSTSTSYYCCCVASLTYISYNIVKRTFSNFCHVSMWFVKLQTLQIHLSVNVVRRKSDVLTHWIRISC